MHRTTKRLASALLAAVLCAAAALPAGADYEPWTYEVDDLMGSYGVEYYGDVGFTDPTAGRSAARSPASAGVSTQSAGTSGGISTYSAAETGTAVDTGLGYTITQLPGGITLYSPTDNAVATYALDSDVDVSNDVATYAASDYHQVSGSDSGAQTFAVTIPSTLELEDGEEQSMTVTGQVYSYSTLNISVNRASGTHQLKCSEDANSPTLDYTLTCGDLLTSAYNNTGYAPVEGSNGVAAGSWENAVTANSGSMYLKATLTAKLAEENSYNVAGTYTDTLTFTMTSSRKKFTVEYDVNGGTAVAGNASKIYVCGGSGTLPTAEILGFTAPSDNMRFIGWATWKDVDEAGASKKVYAPGMSFAAIAKNSESDIKNAYTAKEPSTVTLYAYWRKKGESENYTANVYVQKASITFSATNGVDGSGVYEHEDNTDNYVKGGTEKDLSFFGETVQLNSVDIAPGESFYWSLEELENHLPTGTIPSDKKIYLENGKNAARVVASEETDDSGKPTVTLYINRNQICFDLNARVKVIGADTYTNGGSLSFALKDERKVDLGTADVTVYGQNVTNRAHTDCWQIVTYGTEVTVTVKAASPFKLVGYRCEAGGTDQLFGTKEDEYTFKVIVEPTLTAKSYSFYPLFEEVTEDADTLLPSWDETTKPVVIGMPAADADDADDTTGTAKDTTKADDTAKDTDTIGSIFDEPEQDITPDDLMITDADDMLARMDAAFAMPYLDDPA